jgi:hypothetical protein
VDENSSPCYDKKRTRRRKRDEITALYLLYFLGGGDTNDIAHILKRVILPLLYTHPQNQPRAQPDLKTCVGKDSTPDLQACAYAETDTRPEQPQPYPRTLHALKIHRALGGSVKPSPSVDHSTRASCIDYEAFSRLFCACLRWERRVLEAVGVVEGVRWRVWGVLCRAYFRLDVGIVGRVMNLGYGFEQRKDGWGLEEEDVGDDVIDGIHGVGVGVGGEGEGDAVGEWSGCSSSTDLESRILKYCREGQRIEGGVVVFREQKQPKR